MKKTIKIIAAILAVLALLAVIAVLITSDSFKDRAWTDISVEELEIYINEKVIPIVVMVATAIGTILMALLPVINGIKSASEKFSAAEAGIKNTADAADKKQAESKLLFEEAKAYFEQTLAVSRGLDEKMNNITAMEARIEETMRIGFCNTPSLVRNGYARKIYELGKTSSQLPTPQSPFGDSSPYTEEPLGKTVAQKGAKTSVKGFEGEGEQTPTDGAPINTETKKEMSEREAENDAEKA